MQNDVKQIIITYMMIITSLIMISHVISLNNNKKSQNFLSIQQNSTITPQELNTTLSIHPNTTSPQSIPLMTIYNKTNEDLIKNKSSIESISSNVIQSSQFTNQIVSTLDAINDNLAIISKELIKENDLKEHLMLDNIENQILEKKLKLAKSLNHIEKIKSILPPLTSLCATFKSCASCSSSTACGWCSETNSCIDGTENGPTIETCYTFEFNSCSKKGDCTKLMTCNDCLQDISCAWCFEEEEGNCMEQDTKECPAENKYHLWSSNSKCPRLRGRKFRQQQEEQEQIQLQNEEEDQKSMLIKMLSEEMKRKIELEIDIDNLIKKREEFIVMEMKIIKHQAVEKIETMKEIRTVLTPGPEMIPKPAPDVNSAPLLVPKLISEVVLPQEKKENVENKKENKDGLEEKCTDKIVETENQKDDEIKEKPTEEKIVKTISQDINKEIISKTEEILEKETTQETAETRKEETPEKTTEEAPKETTQETPEETPIETPRETPEETPIETPEEKLIETTQETPEETPIETPIEIPEEKPIETPEETTEEETAKETLSETSNKTTEEETEISKKIVLEEEASTEKNIKDKTITKEIASEASTENIEITINSTVSDTPSE